MFGAKFLNIINPDAPSNKIPTVTLEQKHTSYSHDARHTLPTWGLHHPWLGWDEWTPRSALQFHEAKQQNLEMLRCLGGLNPDTEPAAPTRP